MKPKDRACLNCKACTLVRIPSVGATSEANYMGFALCRQRLSDHYLHLLSIRHVCCWHSDRYPDWEKSIDKEVRRYGMKIMSIGGREMSEYTKGELDIEGQVLEAIKEVLDFSDPNSVRASIILARLRTILGLKDLASAPDMYEACVLMDTFIEKWLDVLLSNMTSEELHQYHDVVKRARTKAEGGK